MVHVVAHRGFSGCYPENTEIAFVKALELGVEMVELDLHLSQDKELIVIHDPTVDRTSDGSGRVADMTLAEIKELDAGSWLSEEFRGMRFLIFQEALDILGTDVRLNVHVKACEQDRDAIIPLAVDILRQRDFLDTAFIASDEASIRLARQLEPVLAICNLSTSPRETYIARSLAIGCTILQPSNRQVDPEFVREAHRHGMEVNPFYADEEAEMQRLIDCGVDGILTNHPDRLLALRTRSASSPEPMQEIKA